MHQSIHFWRKCQSLSDAIGNLNYEAPGEVNLTRSGCTNLISNNPLVPQEERICKRERKEPGFKLLIRLELKKTVWMKNIVQKFSKSGNLVMKACAGISQSPRLANLFQTIEDS